MSFDAGGEGTAKVDGEVLGPLVVHNGVGKDESSVELWHVTHRDSGVRLVSVRKCGDAKRVCEVLVDRCTRAMAKSSGEEIRDNLPAWAAEWLQACQRDRGFVPVGE